MVYLCYNDKDGLMQKKKKKKQLGRVVGWALRLPGAQGAVTAQAPRSYGATGYMDGWKGLLAWLLAWSGL